MLTDLLCVKYGSRVHLPEASTMRFISQNTSIPVSRVYCAFTHQDCTRIQGIMMGAGWVKRSEESKTRLLSQLGMMIREIREIQPPKDVRSASVDSGSLFDCRVSGPSLRFGTFCSIHDFHLHLREGMRLILGLVLKSRT